MVKSVEVIIKDKSPVKIETNDKAFKDFINYLNEKHTDWEEFFISNNFSKQLRVLKKQNELMQIPKTLAIGNLLVWLDKTHKDWNRFAISNKKFVEIKYEAVLEGMLVRANSSNTNQYIYIDSVSSNSKDEKELHCIQEGDLVTFNTINCSKYKFTLLAEKIDKVQFESIDWAEYK